MLDSASWNSGQGPSKLLGSVSHSILQPISYILATKRRASNILRISRTFGRWKCLRKNWKNSVKFRYSRAQGSHDVSHVWNLLPGNVSRWHSPSPQLGCCSRQGLSSETSCARTTQRPRAPWKYRLRPSSPFNARCALNYGYSL